MKVETKTLFKLWGRIKWIDKDDEPHFFFIPEDTKSERWFKWAPGEEAATRLFKREVQKHLQETEALHPKYLPKFYHIDPDQEATIEKLKSKKVPVQKQLRLF